MPHFGAADVSQLSTGLAALDGEELEAPPVAEAADAKAGLVGRDLIGRQGFTCTACHDLMGWQASVAFVDSRGPDLSLAPARLRESWFRRWLLDPQALAPGTKMPTYFPEGKSTLEGRHGLGASGQIDAMLQYLAMGSKAPLPAGMRNAEGWSWVASGRPALLRTPFDAAARTICVGFPEGVSFAYDAEGGQSARDLAGGFLRMNGTQWTGSTAPTRTPRARICGERRRATTAGDSPMRPRRLPSPFPRIRRPPADGWDIG